MHFDICCVKADRLDTKTQDVHLLKRCNDRIVHTNLGATTNTGIDRMPVAETLGQSAPLAAMRDHIKKGIAHLSIANGDVAPVNSKVVCDERALLLRDFYRA